MQTSFLPETNWVDIIVVIFVIRGAYIGLTRGFSIELFKFLGTIGAAVLSLLYYERLGTWLSAHTNLSPVVANSLSFVVLISLLLFIFTIVRTLSFKVLHVELIAGWESWAGFILGIIRSLILVSLFLHLLLFIPVEYIKESVEKTSFSGPYLERVAPKVLKFVVQFRPKAEPEEPKK